jgi:hypothetical protein
MSGVLTDGVYRQPAAASWFSGTGSEWAGSGGDSYTSSDQQGLMMKDILLVDLGGG